MYRKYKILMDFIILIIFEYIFEVKLLELIEKSVDQYLNILNHVKDSMREKD